MSDEARRRAAFVYQVEVCERILKDYPDAHFNRGFACFDFSDEQLADNECRYEAFQELKKDYPNAQPYALMFTPGLPKYGNGRVAGWSDILYAQRQELERQ